MTSTLIKKHRFDTVFDNQKVFRLLLEAMSNPLRSVSMREFAEQPGCSGFFPVTLPA